MENCDSIDDIIKITKLEQINKTLGLEKIETKFRHNNVIFVYSVPKVGSTSLVSSLKLFAFFGFAIIHIHSETMIEVFSHIKNISVIELINYNAENLKRNVYVIDIYRSPIEHKISTYFEKIASFHFNTTNQNIDNYEINKLIKRFNLIFPYIAIGDIFMDKYQIDKITDFNHKDKYLFYKNKNIKYLKLRLKDVKEWNKIIKNVLNIDLIIVKDYASSEKPFKNTYGNFMKNYKIPCNFLENIIKKCKYFNYYYSEEEKYNYLQEWQKKTSEDFLHMTQNEYLMYQEICFENQTQNFIDKTHYIYNGCVCKGCLLKRQILINNLLKNNNIKPEKIIHQYANYDLAKIKCNQINNQINNQTKNQTKNKMNNINRHLSKNKYIKQNMKNIIS